MFKQYNTRGSGVVLGYPQGCGLAAGMKAVKKSTVLRVVEYVIQVLYCLYFKCLLLWPRLIHMLNVCSNLLLAFSLHATFVA